MTCIGIAVSTAESIHDDEALAALSMMHSQRLWRYQSAKALAVACVLQMLQHARCNTPLALSVS